MSQVPYRIMILITNPKPAAKASLMFVGDKVPMHYLFHGMGTASSEMMDILGLDRQYCGISVAQPLP